MLLFFKGYFFVYNAVCGDADRELLVQYFDYILTSTT